MELNIEQPEYLFGDDSDGMIAMLWNETYSFLGINTSARFSTPIKIKRREIRNILRIC